jgi:hypothetical protein
MSSLAFTPKSAGAARVSDGPSPISYTSALRTVNRPHATIALGDYMFVWDRASTKAAKINAYNFADVTYFESQAMTTVCLGDDGFIYGISEQGACPLYRFNPATLATTTLVATPPIVQGVGPSICTDGAGTLFVIGTDSTVSTATRLLKYRASDGTQLASRLITGKRNGHAIDYVGGALWLSGVVSISADGWWAKASASDLSDILAPADFAPGGGEILVPTDDFAFDATHVYFVTEVQGTAPKMARINQSSGAVVYYTMPGGAVGAAYTALWDGGTGIIIPQFARRGVVAVFDTVALTFRSSPVSYGGSINEIVRFGQVYLVTSYSNVPMPEPTGGLIARIRLDAPWNGGPYFDLDGNLTLPTGAVLNVGDQDGTVEAGIINGYVSVNSILGAFTTLASTKLIVAGATPNGYLKLSDDDGTLVVEEGGSGTDLFSQTGAADPSISVVKGYSESGAYGFKMTDTAGAYGTGDEGVWRYSPGGAVTFFHSLGSLLFPLLAIAGAKVLINPIGDDIRTNAGFDLTANTTLSLVSGMSAVLAVGFYEFEFCVQITASAAGGHKLSITSDLTVANVLYTIVSTDLSARAIVAADRLTATGGSGIGQAGATKVESIVRGTVEVLTADTTLSLRFAQWVASGTSTVLAGTTMKVRSLA